MAFNIEIKKIWGNPTSGLSTARLLSLSGVDETSRSRFIGRVSTVISLVTVAGLMLGLESCSHQLSASPPQPPRAATTSPANETPLPQVASPAPTTTTTLASLSDRAIAKKAGSCQFDQSMYPNTGITFEVKSFQSQALKQERKYGLILPPGYNENPSQYYPVIFLLHGGHGYPDSWEKCGAATEVLDKLYKSGKLPPAIVITPDGSDLRGSSPYWDPEYYNGSHGQIDTLIGSELVNLVKTQYRAIPNSKYWAMGGLSSGGWGAFNIGLRHLDNFHILFSLSGYFVDASGAKNSPAKLVQKLSINQRQELKAYLNAGESDKKFLTSTKEFAQTLNKLNISYELEVPPGGHGTDGEDSGWYYWHKHLTDALTYVGEQWK